MKWSNLYYQRGISSKIVSLAAHFPAVVLTGARQSGKTTLLRHLFPDHTYVSLDLPAQAELADYDPEAFLQRFPPPLVIDEVQYAPRVFRHVKVAIDRNRQQMGRFILTGSQKFVLMREVSDSLAGRCAVVELENLSVAELGSDFHRAETSLADRLVRGFFPELWVRTAMPQAEFYGSYLATYIERDVRQILRITSLRDFDRFMRVVATRTGQLLNKTEIGKAVGIATKTVGDWLSVLEASNQIVLLEPHFKSVGKRLVKSPKLYFSDVGLASFLLGVSPATFLHSAHAGALWETFVFGELRKEAHQKPEATFWFYRDQSREVDFVVSYGGRLAFADAKLRELPRAADFDRLSATASLFREAHADTWLICPTAMESRPVAPHKVAVSGFAIPQWLRALG